MLLLFFNPATQSDLRLRQCLSVFFNVFAGESQDNRLVIESAFYATLSMLFKAPVGSSLAEVSATTVVKYFLYLTDPELLHVYGTVLGGTKTLCDLAHVYQTEGQCACVNHQGC